MEEVKKGKSPFPDYIYVEDLALVCAAHEAISRKPDQTGSALQTEFERIYPLKLNELIKGGAIWPTIMWHDPESLS